MACAAAFARGNAHQFTRIADTNRGAIAGIAPAEPDHLLIFLPAHKGVFSGVVDVNASALAHVRREVTLHRFRPIRFWFHSLQKAVVAVFVAGLDHHIVIGKTWPPRLPGSRASLHGRRADRDVKFACRLKNPAQNVVVCRQSWLLNPSTMRTRILPWLLLPKQGSAQASRTTSTQRRRRCFMPSGYSNRLPIGGVNLLRPGNPRSTPSCAAR